MSLPRGERVVLCPGRASMACGWVTGSCAGPVPVGMSPSFKSLSTAARFFKRKINPVGLGTHLRYEMIFSGAYPSLPFCSALVRSSFFDGVSEVLSQQSSLRVLWGKALLIFLFVLCLNLRGAQSSTKPSTTAEQEELHTPACWDTHELRRFFTTTSSFRMLITINTPVPA